MLTITPERLAAGYELLRASPPFCRWNLPKSDAVRFRVLRTRTKFGDYCPIPVDTFRVSAGTVSQLEGMLIVLAHEIVHLRLKRMGAKNWDKHGEEFLKLSAAVCKVHGWDVKGFV